MYGGMVEFAKELAQQSNDKALVDALNKYDAEMTGANRDALDQVLSGASGVASDESRKQVDVLVRSILAKSMETFLKTDFAAKLDLQVEIGLLDTALRLSKR
eukprot:1023128-Amphidinium_carterae.1